MSGGRKNTLPSFRIITSGDMSQASLTSTPVNIQFLDNICMQLVWTGTPVGTFDVQGSLTYNQDANGNILNAGTWSSLTLNPSPAATGASGGNILIDMNQLSFPWVRLVYTKGSSTGTLQAYVGGKMV